MNALCLRFQALGRHSPVMGVLLLAGGLRLWLLLQGWPQTDSDEGTMGLMALHIAYDGAHPVVFYGQDYLAPFEAYLAAPLFRLAGPSLLTLRLSVLLLYLLFLVSLYCLVCLLYGRGLALFSLLLLALGPSEVLFRQLEAAGGAPDVTLFSALLPLAGILLATGLRTRPRSTSGRLARWRLLLACALWGLLAGMAIWDDPLILPFAALGLIFLLICCWRELRGWPLVLLLLGLLLGLAPQLLYQLFVPPSPERLALLGPGYREPSYPPPPGASTASTSAQPTVTPSPLTQLAGSLFVSLPLATGGNTLCTLGPSQSWPLTGQGDRHVLLCTTVHGLWSLAYLLLWGYACGQALRACLTCWRARAGEDPDQPRVPLKEAGRLLVLASSGSTLFLYTLFQSAARTPWASSRYLVGLLVNLPCLLAPLWQGASCPDHRALALSSTRSPVWGQAVKGLAIRLALAVPLLAWLIGMVTLLGQAPGVAAINKQQQALVDHLLAQGTTLLYSDYWDCDRIVFQSNERLICAVLDSGLQRGLNRYQPYWAQVSQASQPAYVFPVDSPQDLRLQALLQSGSAAYRSYRRELFRGYAIYAASG